MLLAPRRIPLFDEDAHTVSSFLRSDRTASVLTALDAKIADVSSNAEAARLGTEEHEKRRDALLGELLTARANKKAQGGMSLMGGPQRGNSGDYMMDVDEDGGGGGGGFLGLDWGRKKNARPAGGAQGTQEKGSARKRNRF